MPQRIFHFGRVCQYTEQDFTLGGCANIQNNNSFSENISLWEGVPIYRIFHFGRVCQYTEQATITGGEYFTLGGCASENISLWEGVPIYKTNYNNSFGRRIFHFGRVCQYTEQDFTLGGCANIQNNNSFSENISLWEGVPI